MRSLAPKHESRFLKSPVLQPLAVLIFTRKLAPSLHFLCVYKANYLFFFSIYTIATSGPATLALGSSAES